MSVKGIIPYSDGTETLGREEVKNESGNVIQDKRYYKAVYTNKIVSPQIDEIKATIEDKAKNSKVDELVGMIGGANAPCYYARDIRFSTVDKNKIKTPEELWININKRGLKLSAQLIIDININSSWDTDAKEWQAGKVYIENDVVYTTSKPGYLYRCKTGGTSSTLTPTFPTELGQTYNDGSVVWQCQLDYTKASNRVGKDFYMYACAPTNGSSPIIILSDNATVPLWYQAVNSRKIGGFHCLCSDVGTIDGHALNGYVLGDILPASLWDLRHRPKSDPEGMVYIEGIDLWVDIYLASHIGATTSRKLVSKYGGIIADGSSTPTYTDFDFIETFGKQNKRLLWQYEYECATQGSPQGVAILGATDPTTTGAHKATNNVRLISNFGLEDGVGVMWTWTADYFYYQTTCSRGLGGGYWASGASCGSRYANNSTVGTLNANYGARSASDTWGDKCLC